MSDITTKFEDFKKKELNNFDKSHEYKPLSSDIIALGKLDDGNYEKITEPVEIIQILDVITDPDEIKNIEENFTLDTNLSLKEIKRGDIIWLSAMLKKKGSSSWNTQSLGVVKVRVVDFYYGLNKINSIKKINQS
jgi:hypothetical protein